MAFDYLMRIISVLNQPLKTAMKINETKGWKLRDSRRISCGIEYALRVPFGSSYEEAQKCLDALIATCGKPVELEDWQGSVVVRVMEKPMITKIPLKLKMLEGLKPGEILLGYTITGEKITFNWEHPHGIFAGETGSGKTDMIRLFTFCLLRDPEEIDIRVIDLKYLSFLPFKGVKNLKVITGVPAALVELTQIASEVKRRNEMVEKAGTRKAIAGLRKIVVIIDEAADISPAAYTDKDMKKIAARCENAISFIVREGREVRIHLMYCTQYPTAQLVSNQIKINCTFRVCFSVSGHEKSQVVLDATGAEKLGAIPGRAIVRIKMKFATVQVPFGGNDDAWERRLMPFKQEVIYGGASSRTDKERVHREGSFRDAHRDDGATGHVIQLQQKPTQKSESTSAGTAAGKDDRVGVVPKTKTVEIIQKGTVDDGTYPDED